ncbi:unnamed protein product [Calypogeia fissa]
MSKRMYLLLVALLLPLTAFWTTTAAPPHSAQDMAGTIQLYTARENVVPTGTVETGITALVGVVARISSRDAITVRNGRTRLHVQDDVKFFVDSLATEDVPVQKDWLKKAMEGVIAEWKSTRKKTAERCPGGHMYFSDTHTLAAGFFKVGFGEPVEKFGLEYASTNSIVLTEQQRQGSTLSKETAEAMVFYKFAVTNRPEINLVLMRLVEKEIPKLYTELSENSLIPIRRGFTMIDRTTKVNFFLDSGVDSHFPPITKRWVQKAMEDLLVGCKILKPKKKARLCAGGHKRVADTQQIVVGFASNAIVYREHPLETEAGQESGARSKRKERGSSTPEDRKGKRTRTVP